MIQQRREIDLKDVFYYFLDPVLWSIASVPGGMVKIKMSSLIHKLEMGITLVDAIPKPFSSLTAGMALVRQSNYIDLIYSEFVDNILKFETTTAFGAYRIHMVFDVYRPDLQKLIELQKEVNVQGENFGKNICGCCTS